MFDINFSSVETTLRNLVDTLNNWTKQEHDSATGAHANVTALSLVVSGLLTFFRLRSNAKNWTTVKPAADGVIFVDKPYTHVRIFGAPRIDGLFHSLYDVGDLVILSNANDDSNSSSATDITIRLQSSAAPNAQFRGDPGTPNNDHALKAGRSILLIRDRDIGGGVTDIMYWRSVGLP